MDMKKIAKETATAVVCSFLITVLFLVLVAFVALKAGLGENVISGMMMVIYVLAPAVGGFVLGKKRKVNRFLWGLCVGIVYFIVYVILALLTKTVPFTDIAWVAVPVCLGGMAGGMLS